MALHNARAQCMANCGSFWPTEAHTFAMQLPAVAAQHFVVHGAEVNLVGCSNTCMVGLRCRLLHSAGCAFAACRCPALSHDHSPLLFAQFLSLYTSASRPTKTRHVQPFKRSPCLRCPSYHCRMPPSPTASTSAMPWQGEGFPLPTLPVLYHCSNLLEQVKSVTCLQPMAILKQHKLLLVKVDPSVDGAQQSSRSLYRLYKVRLSSS